MIIAEVIRGENETVFKINVDDYNPGTFGPFSDPNLADRAMRTFKLTVRDSLSYVNSKVIEDDGEYWFQVQFGVRHRPGRFGPFETSRDAHDEMMDCVAALRDRSNQWQYSSPKQFRRL